MTLNNADTGREYIIRAIDTDDEEMDAFLFSLGCFSGEPITVVSRLKGGCVVAIKDGRYTIGRGHLRLTQGAFAAHFYGPPRPVVSSV